MDSENQLIVEPVKPSNRGSRGKLLIALIIVLLVAILIFAITLRVNKTSSDPSTTSTAQIQAGEVTVTNAGFVPASITIKAGEAVSWINQEDAPHQVASDPYPTEDTVPGLNAKSAAKRNEKFTYTFSKSGTYTYHDHVNPDLKGTIIVQ